jgi:hypothetical protein
VSPALAIQAALRSGVTFEHLAEQYGIRARRHRHIEPLISFKYDQIASPFAEQIVRECRGIVLDESDDWRVVSRSFDKFFNHGEGHAAEIDWSTARVQEKADGSLCTVYWYGDAWHVATTGTPDGEGNVNATGATFAEYFWATFRQWGHGVPPETPRNLCFLFELMGPANRIVVVHPEPHLVLLAVRCRETGDFLNEREWAPRLGAKAIRSFPLGSVEEIAESFASISPLSQEGYVVVDGTYNRIKIKHPGYVALHHAKDGLTEKAFIEIARSGETCEVITAFPEYAPLLESARDRVGAFVASLEADYAELRDIEGQKDFALKAVKTRCSSALFAVRSKKAESIRAFVRDMQIDKLAEYLGAAS